MLEYLGGLIKLVWDKVIGSIRARFHLHFIKIPGKTELDVTCEIGQPQQETRLE